MPDRSPPRPNGRVPDVIVDDPVWRRAIPDIGRRAARAVTAAGGADGVLLTSDRALRRLNRDHRGIDKATNVLSFERPGGGDLALAYGVLRREARAQGRPLRHHLAHLLVHGTLHLHGADHIGAGEARAMELAEARILRRLGVPNPRRPGA